MLEIDMFNKSLRNHAVLTIQKTCRAGIIVPAEFWLAHHAKILILIIFVGCLLNWIIIVIISGVTDYTLVGVLYWTGPSEKLWNGNIKNMLLKCNQQLLWYWGWDF